MWRTLLTPDLLLITNVALNAVNGAQCSSSSQGHNLQRSRSSFALCLSEAVCFPQNSRIKGGDVHLHWAKEAERNVSEETLSSILKPPQTGDVFYRAR